MSARIKYTDESLGEIEVIPDFLPPPDELACREDGVKVTLLLNKKSVDFFKSEAAKHHTQYQRMVRRVLDAYVETEAGILVVGYAVGIIYALEGTHSVP